MSSYEFVNGNYWKVLLRRRHASSAQTGPTPQAWNTMKATVSSYMRYADEWKSYFRLKALFLFITTIISEETDTYRVYLLEETVINIRWRQGKRGDS